MAGDFSDEEWDISDDQLSALEHNAILSTQQQQIKDRSGSRDISNNNNNNRNSGSTLRLDTPVPQKVVAAASGAQPQQNVQRRNEDSFDNPALDEDGVPLVVEEQSFQPYAQSKRVDETAQREQWRQNRFAQKNGQPQYRPPAKAIPHRAYQTYQQQNPQYGRSMQQNQALPAQRTPVGTQLTPGSQSAIHQPAPLVAPSVTHSELEKERRERELLQQKLDSLTAELHTAKGENAVIRGKNANDAKLAERQLNAAKRQMQELATKHQAELQSRDAAYTELTTHYKFVQHELDVQSLKINTLQKQAKDKSVQDRPSEAIPSPRKNLHNTLRDGFDDDQMLQLSPARSPARRKSTKPTTPSKKRKLPVNGVDEPALTLNFSQPQVEAQEPPIDEQTKPKPAAQIVKDYQTEEHLRLLQAVLNFHPPGSRDNLVESLVNHSFPSDPNRSLSSLLLLDTSQLKGNRFPGDLLGVFVKLLDKCVKEDYYSPLSILLPVVELVLDLDPTVVDAELIQTLVQTLQNLAMTNPRKRWALENNKVWDENKPKPKLNPDVNTTYCLDLLFTIASLALDEPELLRLFWRRVDTELVLLMLFPFQPIPDLHLMLELLSTSIQPTTFGNICTPEQQGRMETYIVDKICFLLLDPPKHPVKLHPRRPYSSASATIEKQPKKLTRLPKDTDPDPIPEPPPTRLEICNLRLHVLALLSSLLSSSRIRNNDPQIAHRGTSIFLSHPTAIARLVRVLYDEVNALSSNLPTQALHAKLVNTTTTLLHQILLSSSATDPKGSFELQRALSGTLLGVHKFRVVMTRIAFREEKPAGDIQEDDISEESVIKATEILETYVTPDEAVQLVEVLGRADGEGDEIDGGYEKGQVPNGEDGMDVDGDEEAERAEADVMAGIEH